MLVAYGELTGANGNGEILEATQCRHPLSKTLEAIQCLHVAFRPLFVSLRKVGKILFDESVRLCNKRGKKSQLKPTIKSKHRVAKYGEVLTPQHIVNDMLDLVKQETERIDSRFLEPACGTGNFLIEILERKLRVVENRYGANQLEYERYAILAVSSIYGIELLEDNAEECRNRLFEVFDAAYMRLFQSKAREQCREAARYILRKNIINGDALTPKTVGTRPQPIVFPEWSLVNGSMIKRRDFAFHALINKSAMRELPLFSNLGEEVFIPEPVREYPTVHFLEVSHAYGE